MQVEELYDLTTWVIKELVDKQIVEKFQQLHQVLSHNAKPNQQKQPFTTQQDVLLTALRAVPLDLLSMGQIDTLRVLGIAQNVGADGAALVEDLLFKNALDVANAAQRINQVVGQLTEGVTWFQRQRDLLREIIISDSVSEIDDKVLLRVHFAGNASVDNLTDLKEWSKIWWDIGRRISMAHGQSPETIQVIGASKGSIIVSLLTAQAIAATVSGIILAALKVVEKYYEIKRKAQEVRALEIENDQAEKALEKAAQHHKESGISQIVEQTIVKLDLDAKKEGDKVSELSSATKKLIDFISKGGEVDFVMPNNEEAEPDDVNAKSKLIMDARAELRAQLQEVRKLEREVKKLEHHRS